MDFPLFAQQFPLLFYLLVFVFGLSVGSFLNVVIYRLPLMMQRQWKHECQEFLENTDSTSDQEQETFNLMLPASHCPACHHKIGARENIPVLSYLLLKGRCASCSQTISSRYPLTELLTGLLSVIIAWHFGANLQMLTVLGLTYALVTLSLIDVDHQLLPDQITYPLLWSGLLVNLFGLFTDLESAVIGAIAGYLSLWSVYWLFKLTTGKEGMGHGDFKLLAVFGAWLGWAYLPQIILLSSLVGAVIGISLIIALGRDRNIPIPFGPYLAIAGWIAVLWGETINQGYLQFAGLN